MFVFEIFLKIKWNVTKQVTAFNRKPITQNTQTTRLTAVRFCRVRLLNPLFFHANAANNRHRFFLFLFVFVHHRNARARAPIVVDRWKLEKRLRVRKRMLSVSDVAPNSKKNACMRRCPSYSLRALTDIINHHPNKSQKSLLKWLTDVIFLFKNIKGGP